MEFKFKVPNERPDNEYLSQVRYTALITVTVNMIQIEVYFLVFLLGLLLPMAVYKGICKLRKDREYS